MEKIRLLNERILIKQDKARELTEGGLHLPNTSEQPSTGVIVAVGNGDIVSKTFSIGDKVMFEKMAGREIEIESEKYKALIYHEVMMIM